MKISDDKGWWVARAGEKTGPLTAADLVKLIADGQLDGKDLLWSEGMLDWVPAAEIEGLLPAAPATQPVAPPPLPPSATAVPVLASPDGARVPPPGPSAGGAAEGPQRVYRAPRLDAAFDALPKLTKYGMTALPVAVLLTFVASGPGWGMLALIGAIAYWVTLLKNKGKLEVVERELCNQNRADGLPHDLTELGAFWHRFGPIVSFCTSILAVLLMFARWFVNRVQENDRRY